MMRTTKPVTQGIGPIHDDVYVGQDGQLWQWDHDKGQVVIATSGPQAVQYARDHNWPDHLIRRLALLQQRLV